MMQSLTPARDFRTGSPKQVLQHSAILWKTRFRQAANRRRRSESTFSLNETAAMRSLVRSAVVSLHILLVVGLCRAEKPWIIDPHTHFKGAEQITLEAKVKKLDPRNSLGQVVEPKDYRDLADRLAIQSTLVIEAVDQENPQFNDWVLSQAKSDLICGYVARGDLASEQFLGNYGRYRKSGFLKGYRFRFDELHGYLDDEAARKNLSILERDGMVVDLLIEFQHAPDVVELARRYPKLKIVINHCFRAKLKDGRMNRAWQQAIKDCAKFPNVYCKISSILNFAPTEPFDEVSPGELEYYLPVLNPCFDAFGEDRVIFATNWGVSAHFGSVDDVVRIVHEFLASKGERVIQKGMRENAIRVYGISKSDLR